MCGKRFVLWSVIIACGFVTASCAGRNGALPQQQPGPYTSSAIALDWSRAGTAQSALVTVDAENDAQIVNRSLAASSVALRGRNGRHTIFLSLRAGSNGSGKLIGTAAFTISADATASITPDVGGACASITLAPVGPEPFVEGTPVPPGAVGGPPGSRANPYVDVGPQPQLFIATPLDAQGNPIIPPFPQAGTVALVQLGARNFDIDRVRDNIFRFTPLHHVINAQTAIVPFAFECANVASTLARNPINFALASSVYVADTSGSGTIRAFDPDGNEIHTSGGFPRPIVCQPSTFFNPLFSVVNDIAYDEFLGRLYVPTPGCGVGVFDLDGNAISVSGTFPQEAGANGGAFDPRTRWLWVATSGMLVVYDENGNLIGESSNFAPLGPISASYDTALDRMYVAATGPSTDTTLAFSDILAPITTPGNFPISTSAVAEEIAFDALNNTILEPDSIAQTIRVYDENGYLLSSGTFSGLNAPFGVVVDSFQKHIFVTNCPNTAASSSGGFVSRFDAGGTLQTLPPSAFASLGCPDAITVVAP
ncbi:MAG: hypothetical protein JO165_09565 [Candidatus Eremiobacteraeota bacterium]|nr:hypothetical protein [Candidatus Eremiobacteraeota bacterium]